MNWKALQLSGSARTETANVTRAGGSVPAVVYGHGIENEQLAVDARQFQRVFEEAGYTTLLSLDVAGKEHNVLIREVQFHPVKDHVMHIDFYQVRLDEEVTADVPLEFVGEAPAVKDLGGVLVRNIDSLEIEALPQNLPHNLEVDVSVLTDFEKAIHVSDVPLPEGVTVLAEADTVVALVQAPRSEEELESLSEEVSEDVASVEGVADKPAEGEEGTADGGAPAEGEPEKKDE